MLDFAIWLLTYIVPFVAVLTVIVFVHEMGHYLVARWNGIAVHTFSIGFGPELIGRTDRHGTRWRLSAIPLGGYVRFLGDLNAASQPDADAVARIDPALQPALFVNKSVWRRIAVVGAGPAANVLFAFLVIYAMLLGFGRYTIPPVIDTVVADSVAESAGMEPGDRIVSVDGYAVHGFNDFQRLVSTSPERTVTIEVLRAGESREFVIVPEPVQVRDAFGNPLRIGRIGVSRQTSSADVELYRPGPAEAVGMTFEEIRFIIDRTAAFVGDFFVGRGDFEQLGGPVKVAQVSGEVATLGIMALINLMALLSLNIGLVNLLPIPLLDGGHLLYYAFEVALRRPLSPRVQEIGFRIGLILVTGLMLFTVINDIV
ncbi:MAG: RIP metalloprotease RseP [Alphaproteobacteria bacterium]|nr:RIP metalloprotease RseP [Alphaproteobacteria bacterium]